MKRREFVKYLSYSLPFFSCGCSFHLPAFLQNNETHNEVTHLEDMAPTAPSPATPEKVLDAGQDITKKSLNFNENFKDDIYCTGHDAVLLEQLLIKFRAVQRYVGNGNFNLIGMDEFFFFARTAARIEPVTREEKEFLEKIFNFDASLYGFYGEKNFTSMTQNIPKNTVVKVPYTGHFLRKGPSLETYNRIKKDVGDSIILTSGVRALAKQFHLFFEKAQQSDGNLSKASRSLAPPGYSFHGHNDFDIGKVGFGINNFNEKFATTREFQILKDLGYVDIRYEEMNSLGVRYEPWHIKI